jgi:hypothetical protein
LAADLTLQRAFAREGENGRGQASKGARRFFVWLICFIASTSPLCAAPFLVGTWFGTGQPNDKSEMWIAQMLPNGDFRAQFRACIKGQALDQTNTGTWVLQGDIETISIITIDDQFWPRTDVYKILSHDSQRQTYRYLKTGFVYNSKRVDDKFQMPSCETIS